MRCIDTYAQGPVGDSVDCDDFRDLILTWM